MQTQGEGLHPEQTLPGGDGEPNASSLALRGGTRLGRYRLLHKVGAGTSGVVLAAQDPRLGRTIAIKVLHAQSERARADLAREARALARLSHPNILSVLDVGEHRGSVFVATEFVEGTTLDVWLLRETPSTGRILGIFEQIALGLAAAHAAGIVHRDVKPQNVMVDEDGRVRVMDFGLAAEVAATDGTNPTPSASHSVRAPSLSRAQGTPAYMAPEQWLRRPASAQADQYAFCVALYEALWGLHPFGYQFAEMPRRVLEQGPTTPPAAHVRTGAAVPRALVPVILRGLAYAPEDRHPSMDALLAALQGARRKRRRGAMLAALAVGAGVGLLVALLVESDREAACGGAAAKLDGVWDAPTRAAVGETLRATATPYSEHTATRVIEELDDYGAAWTAAYTEACEATRVAGTQPAEVMELRMQCLSRHRQRLRARVDALRHADGRVVEQAVEAVTGLPPVSACDDPVALMSTILPPPDAATAVRVDRLHEEMARIEALVATGAYGEARERLDATALEIASSEYGPLRVELGLLRSRIHAAFREIDQQIERAREAYLEAVALGMDREAAQAAETAAYACSMRPGHVEEGMRWVSRSRASLERVAGSTWRLEALLERTAGALHHAGGDLEAAERAYLRGLEIARPQSPVAASLLSNLSNLRLTTHEFALAADAASRALVLERAAVGPEHPSVTASMSNLATAKWKLGELEEAVELYRGALRIREAAFGRSNESTHVLLVNLAAVELDRGNLAAALDEMERAHKGLEAEGHGESQLMAILLVNKTQVLLDLLRPAEAEVAYARARRLWEAAPGKDDPEFGRFFELLGRIRLDQNRHVDAVRALDEALAHYRRTVGDDSPRLAFPYRLLGMVETDRENWDDAIAHHARALAIHERQFGAAHLETARDHRDLGNALLKAGRASEAVPRLERAVELLEKLDGAPVAALATSRLYLAEAMAAAGRSRAEYEPLAIQARDALDGQAGYLDAYERALVVLSGGE